MLRRFVLRALAAAFFAALGSASAPAQPAAGSVGPETLRAQKRAVKRLRAKQKKLVKRQKRKAKQMLKRAQPGAVRVHR